MFPFDSPTLTTIALAGLGAAGGALIYILRLEGRLTAHEQTDIVVHANVAMVLLDLKMTCKSTEEKVDRLIERLLP